MVSFNHILLLATTAAAFPLLSRDASVVKKEVSGGHAGKHSGPVARNYIPETSPKAPAPYPKAPAPYPQAPAPIESPHGHNWTAHFTRRDALANANQDATSKPRDESLQVTLPALDADAVNEDVNDIDTAVRHFATTVKSLKGISFTPFQTAGEAVHDRNRQGFGRVSVNSGTFSSAESKAIVSNLEKTIVVSIPDSMEALKAKKALFDQHEYGSKVEAFVKLLKYDQKSFNAEIGRKLSLDQIERGTTLTRKISRAIDEALVAFAA